MPLKNRVSLALDGRVSSEGYPRSSIPSCAGSLSMSAAAFTRPSVHCSTVSLKAFWVAATLSSSALSAWILLQGRLLLPDAVQRLGQSGQLQLKICVGVF